jgi:hypothetical protein
MATGREVALGVVRKLGVGRRDDRVRRRHHQQRVTIRRCLGDRISAHDAARGRAIVDDHRLAERLLQMRLQQTRGRVVEPAGRERHDQPDRPAREGLRGGGRGHESG